MKTICAVGFAASMFVGASALAQTTPAPSATPTPAASPTPTATAAPVQIAAGAQVFGPDGAAVGTIASTGADFAVVKTDKHEVRLPRTAFGNGPNGLAVTLSRDALNASVEEALAKTAEAMKPGAVVSGSGGAQAGTIEKVEGDLITLKLKSGKMVRLPKNSFGAGPNGLMIAMTADQLEAQAAGAGG